jgi:hypothetical protein
MTESLSQIWWRASASCLSNRWNLPSWAKAVLAIRSRALVRGAGSSGVLP